MLQYGPKAVRSIPYVSAAFFPSLKHSFIAYRSSKVSSFPDCIFENHQLWQSGLSRVYSNCCCSCWFEAEIIKIGQSSHKMYSNNIVNFQESTPMTRFFEGGGLTCLQRIQSAYWKFERRIWDKKKDFILLMICWCTGVRFGCCSFVHSDMPSIGEQRRTMWEIYAWGYIPYTSSWEGPQTLVT